MLGLYNIAIRVIGRCGLIFETLSIEIAKRFDNAPLDYARDKALLGRRKSFDYAHDK